MPVNPGDARTAIVALKGVLGINEGIPRHDYLSIALDRHVEAVIVAAADGCSHLPCAAKGEIEIGWPAFAG